MGSSALIIIDVQNDFCPGGALAVPEGDAIIPAINAIAPLFDKVIATQDWHPLNHISFAAHHHKKPYETVTIGALTQVLWPVHCVPGTAGAELHRDLDTSPVDLILRKGTDPSIDSYSAFFENDRVTETGLHYYLQGLNIQNVFLCGLATDYCVLYSALDAQQLGFDTTVIIDATRGIDTPRGSVRNATEMMKERGIHLITHESLAASPLQPA